MSIVLVLLTEPDGGKDTVLSLNKREESTHSETREYEKTYSNGTLKFENQIICQKVKRGLPKTRKSIDEELTERRDQKIREKLPSQ
jgi:hypothetical protein